jgi:hypothetical protein
MSHPDEREAYVLAALYLHSRELTPTVIAERLGLEPTRTSLKGELSIVDDLPPRQEPDHRFILQVGGECPRVSYDSASRKLEALLDELLKRIEPVADRLAQLRDQVSPALMCSYGSYHKPEWFRLSAPLLKRIAALDLPVTVLLAPLRGEAFGEPAEEPNRQ